jgi:hypothetical protein
MSGRRDFANGRNGRRFPKRESAILIIYHLNSCPKLGRAEGSIQKGVDNPPVLVRRSGMME